MSMCDSCKRQRTCWDKNYCEKYERNREQTNEEWFCSLSTEEKAKFIAKIDIKTKDADVLNAYARHWFKWLKEKHNEL